VRSRKRLEKQQNPTLDRHLQPARITNASPKPGDAVYFGAVAQLVSAPDCRSGGCGFESRRPRSMEVAAVERLAAAFVCGPATTLHSVGNDLVTSRGWHCSRIAIRQRRSTAADWTLVGTRILPLPAFRVASARQVRSCHSRSPMSPQTFPRPKSIASRLACSKVRTPDGEHL
jgi:hypothetical protein